MRVSAARRPSALQAAHRREVGVAARVARRGIRAGLARDAITGSRATVGTAGSRLLQQSGIGGRIGDGAGAGHRPIDCSSCLIAAAVGSERPEARNPGFGAARERADDHDRERRFTRTAALQPWKGTLPVSSRSDDGGAETCPSSPDGTPDHPLRVMLGPGAPTTVAGIHRALAGASDGRGRPVKGDAPRCASGFLCSSSPRRSS